MIRKLINRISAKRAEKERLQKEKEAKLAEEDVLEDYPDPYLTYDKEVNHKEATKGITLRERLIHFFG